MTTLEEMYLDKETGELLKPPTKFQAQIDMATITMMNKELKYKDLTKLRKLTVGSAIAKTGLGIATGVIFGKTVFTGVLLGIGTTIVLDVAANKPIQMIGEKIIKQ